MGGKKYIIWIGIFCFAVLSLFLTFNRHNKAKIYTYHSELWADRAGYYMYLPAAFKYNFNPASFPDSIDVKTGLGFHLNYSTKSVETIYTCGVALMQMPFYLVADMIAAPLHYKADGFSRIYNKAVDVAAIFYLVIGLFFLGKVILKYASNTVAFLVLASFFLGTNLFYYAIDDTGMSHVYSFALFSVFLFLMKHTNFLSEKSIVKVFIIGLVAGLIILIRPSNVLFLFTYFFLDIVNKEEIVKRVKRLFNLNIVLPLAVAVIILFLPQLFYWKLTYGTFIKYSYGEYGFNWLAPKLLLTWFSPDNGLFLYTPLYLVLIASFVYMIANKIKNGLYIFILFCLISYVFSSWQVWNFGCSFGARSFVEFLPLFSLPLAVLYARINHAKTFVIVLFYLLIFILVAYNLKMIYSYDECFYGNGDWDWSAYIQLLTSSTK